MGRKDRNPGTQYEETIEQYPARAPLQAAQRTSITIPERIYWAILSTEVERLSKDEAEAHRLFGHMLDPLIGATERKEFVAAFIATPPSVVMGYPRSSTEFPCLAIVSESENEDTSALAGQLGTSLEGERGEAIDAKGSIWECVHGIYVYAEHPVLCLYLYNFVKLIMTAADEVLANAGMIDPHFSGGELSPNEAYLPENMFLRVFRVSAKAVFSAPILITDPASIRLGGLFRTDVNVEGIQGAVGTYEGDDGDDQG